MVYNFLVIMVLILMFYNRFIIKENLLSKKVFILFCIILIGSISAFRFQDYDSDFLRNYYAFIKISQFSWVEVLHYSDEYGHQIIRKIISVFTDNPQWYFIVTSFFIVTSYLLFIYRYSPNVYLSVLLFITIGGYFNTHNVTRQAIAISICLYGIKYILNRNLLKFSLIIYFAVIVHTSAIFFFPLYFLARKKISKKIFLIYAVIAIVLQQFLYPLLSFFQRFIYENYDQESYGMTSSNNVFIIIPSLILLVALWGYGYRKKYIADNDSQMPFNINSKYLNNLFTHMCLIYFICILLSVSEILMFSRIGLYFVTGALILLPMTTDSLKPRTKIAFNLATVLVCVLWFATNNYAGKLNPTPYTPFWWFN